MVMVVLDLEKPAYLTESFINWINYVNNTLMPYVQKISDDLQMKLSDKNELYLERNLEILKEEG